MERKAPTQNLTQVGTQFIYEGWKEINQIIMVYTNAALKYRNGKTEEKASVNKPYDTISSEKRTRQWTEIFK